jgi:hypothetical protein
MKLIPLLDRAGNIKVWADPRSGWVYDQKGNVSALISFDGVFNRQGTQIAWWYGDHIRDRYGHVVLFRPGAKIEGVNMPRPEKLPLPPKVHVPSGHPVLTWLLPPPLSARLQWADFRSLHEGPKRLRAFERKLRSFQQKPS